eukprot:TRINITY_DN15503_c0_g1_i1.p1 TRINITY_DN15503_c0_g1~~TRINITY_DN15503_c0_g1_i1.p1  ORF type:complete len:490 (+),score=59.97 TRINITY_DN15503_c0_g1_i1:85-1554(+)
MPEVHTVDRATSVQDPCMAPGTLLDVTTPRGKQRCLFVSRSEQNEGMLVVDFGSRTGEIPEADASLALCVGAKVRVRSQVSWQKAHLTGQRGQVVWHRRGRKERVKVRFSGTVYSAWFDPCEVRVMQAAMPRSDVAHHSRCDGAPARDWGYGLTKCERCGWYPILNRGCSTCFRRLCSRCLPEHSMDSDGEEVFDAPLQIHCPDYRTTDAPAPQKSALRSRTPPPAGRDGTASPPMTASGSPSPRRVNFAFPDGEPQPRCARATARSTRKRRSSSAPTRSAVVVPADKSGSQPALPLTAGTRVLVGRGKCAGMCGQIAQCGWSEAKGKWGVTLENTDGTTRGWWVPESDLLIEADDDESPTCSPPNSPDDPDTDVLLLEEADKELLLACQESPRSSETTVCSGSGAQSDFDSPELSCSESSATPKLVSLPKPAVPVAAVPTAEKPPCMLRFCPKRVLTKCRDSFMAAAENVDRALSPPPSGHCDTDARH